MPTRKPKVPLERRPNIWVVRHGGQFAVKEERGCAYLTPPIPQYTAIAIARLLARVNRSELIIQGDGGRIRSRDSHGADPFPPEG